MRTDASKYMMGGIVLQNKIPVAFFSKKLRKVQLEYMLTEKELLSVVKTLKHFKTILAEGGGIHQLPKSN